MAAARAAARCSECFASSSRTASTALAAKRFRSHSHGAGHVSSKSLTSNTSEPSSEPKAPKFSRWASPQAWASHPVFGVIARSLAMTMAAPRKNENGDTAIRPKRIGTSSWIRTASWLSNSAIGSGRSGEGSYSACDSRGMLCRIALPSLRRALVSSCAVRLACVNREPVRSSDFRWSCLDFVLGAAMHEA